MKRMDSDWENAGVKMAVIVSFALLVSSFVIWFQYPFSEEQGYSELFWVSKPVVDENGGDFSLVLSVRINSFENEKSQYHFSLFFGSEVVATKDVLLSPDDFEVIDFSVPLLEKPSVPVQVKVWVEQTFSESDSEEKDNRIPFRLISWI